MEILFSFVCLFFSKPTEVNGSDWLMKKWWQMEDIFCCCVLMQQQRIWGKGSLYEITPTLIQHCLIVLWWSCVSHNTVHKWCELHWKWTFRVFFWWCRCIGGAFKHFKRRCGVKWLCSHAMVSMRKKYIYFRSLMRKSLWYWIFKQILLKLPLMKIVSAY